MTPDRFRECLALLAWSQNGLANYLGLSSATTARRWATGETSIPAAVAAWLETLADHHAAHPLPAGWQRNPSQHAPIRHVAIRG